MWLSQTRMLKLEGGKGVIMAAVEFKMERKEINTQEGAGGQRKLCLVERGEAPSLSPR